MEIKIYIKKQRELSCKNPGRSNLPSDELFQKPKDIVIGTRQAGTVISIIMLAAIGTGVSLCF